jgi:hypothetical protein
MGTEAPQTPRVVIVGGGMGGIAAAKKLARAPVAVTLVDAHNYYLFQPLLYEVAGAIVSVEDITHTIRGLLRAQRNAHFRLGRSVAVDLERRELSLENGERISYDFLILATGLGADVERVAGATANAFPLKKLEDALRIRNHLIRRLETVAAHPELVSAGRSISPSLAAARPASRSSPPSANSTTTHCGRSIRSSTSRGRKSRCSRPARRSCLRSTPTLAGGCGKS